MTYKLKDNVLLEHVARTYMLVALRSAWGECPFAVQIAPSMAYVWKWLKEGFSKKAVIARLVSERGFSEVKARKIFDSFISSAETYHYLVNETDR